VPGLVFWWSLNTPSAVHQLTRPEALGRHVPPESPPPLEPLRNAARFPPDFMFQLTAEEVSILKSQSVISSAAHGGRRKPLHAFTEHGVATLSAVLRSPRAIRVSIEIIRTFVRGRGDAAEGVSAEDGQIGRTLASPWVGLATFGHRQPEGELTGALSMSKEHGPWSASAVDVGAGAGGGAAATGAGGALPAGPALDGHTTGVAPCPHARSTRHGAREQGCREGTRRCNVPCGGRDSFSSSPCLIRAPEEQAGSASRVHCSPAGSGATPAAMSTTRFPGESAAYRDARDALLKAEIELKVRTEQVAALRRSLPPGGEPQDYAFEEGPPDPSDPSGAVRPVRLSELFGDRPTLVLYSYMYGPAMKAPCPLCTSFLDGLEGQAHHIRQTVALAVTAKSPIARIRELARGRGWRRLRLVSSAQNSYQRDYHGEDAEGHQMPMMNVFVKRDGGVRHFWGIRDAPRERPRQGRHGLASHRHHVAALERARSDARGTRRHVVSGAEVRRRVRPPGHGVNVTIASVSLVRHPFGRRTRARGAYVNLRGDGGIARPRHSRPRRAQATLEETVIHEGGPS
jgi:predicted dithiol-disulfide oxidoreductase (DUF899 family)